MREMTQEEIASTLFDEVAKLRDENSKLRDELNSALEEIGHHKMAQSDRDRLVCELDVALNGEGGAAQRPALCDVVSQVKDQRWKLVRVADQHW